MFKLEHFLDAGVCTDFTPYKSGSPNLTNHNKMKYYKGSKRYNVVTN
jgi:hypothetical protein